VRPLFRFITAQAFERRCWRRLKRSLRRNWRDLNESPEDGRPELGWRAPEGRLAFKLASHWRKQGFEREKR